MKMALASLLVLGTSSSAFALHPPTSGQSPLEQGIARSVYAFELAVAAQDVDALVALYTPDAVLMVDGFPTFKGTEGVRAFWTGALQGGLKSIELETEKVKNLGGNGRVASEIGRATLEFKPANGPAFTQTGRYLVTWKLIQGKWRLAFDITNNTVNTPAAQ